MKTVFKRILAGVVLAAMCVFSASAVTGTVFQRTYNGISYNVLSHVNINSTRGAYPGASVTSQHGGTVPKGYVMANAVLYNSDGDRLLESGWFPNTANTLTVVPENKYNKAYSTYRGHAEVAFYDANHGDYDYFRNEVPYTPYVSLTRTVNQTDHIVLYNANGESYGTDEAGAIAQIDLDLIRAVGTNGEQGYIRSSDYPELPKHLGDPLPSEQDLPLYTSDGITVIGVYHYGGGQVVESFD